MEKIRECSREQVGVREKTADRRPQTADVTERMNSRVDIEVVFIINRPFMIQSKNVDGRFYW